MKKNLSILVFLFAIGVLFGQAPSKFNYQGVARNAQGVVLGNQSISLKVTIVDGTISGTAVYSESHAAKTNPLGLFTVSIGGGQVLSGEFDKISWGTSDKFIKTEVDPTGGSNYVLVGTSQLLSVPYALQAKNAENVQLKAQEIYYTGGMVTSTVSNSWIASNIKLKVENDGKYLCTTLARAWSAWSADVSYRIRNTTKNIVVGQAVITAADIAGAHQGTASLTRILQLAKGDELVLEFRAVTGSSWQYGGDVSGGGSSINILRIGE